MIINLKSDGDSSLRGGEREKRSACYSRIKSFPLKVHSHLSVTGLALTFSTLRGPGFFLVFFFNQPFVFFRSCLRLTPGRPRPVLITLHFFLVVCRCLIIFLIVILFFCSFYCKLSKMWDDVCWVARSGLEMRNTDHMWVR